MQSTYFPPCIIEGCGRDAKTLNRTLCTTHYNRTKTGTPLEQPVRLVRPARGTCVVPDCEVLDCGPHGYCAKHHGRVAHNGSPDIVKHQRDRDNKWEKHPRWTGSDATYTAVHQRLKKVRGKASERACVDCGSPARQWSYTHDDPRELHSELGPYSADLDRYEARCVSCHKRFDLARLT